MPSWLSWRAVALAILYTTAYFMFDAYAFAGERQGYLALLAFESSQLWMTVFVLSMISLASFAGLVLVRLFLVHLFDDEQFMLRSSTYEYLFTALVLFSMLLSDLSVLNIYLGSLVILSYTVLRLLDLRFQRVCVLLCPVRKHEKGSRDHPPHGSARHLFASHALLHTLSRLLSPLTDQNFALCPICWVTP